jgi:crotonobetainyl-CoA:carnitine CoA-transferase CaiB-like acyl-CoA transferase
LAAPPLLSGLRVVEIGQYIAAPFAATLFADQGAEVVKIERPGGDPYRCDPPRFAAWNRGKASAVLDLKSEDGRAEARHLIDRADVLIENLRPGAMERLGLPLDEMRARRPALVTCSISGFGSTGPSRDDPGWEPLVHARAGGQQGLFTGDRPLWLPLPVASVGAGLFAVIGIGAALVKREATGYGQHVETSLFEAMLFLNAGAIFHPEGHRPRVVRRQRTPVLQTYETSDARAVQVNLSGTQRWRELCQLLEMDDDGGLDFADPSSLAKLADKDWCDRMLAEVRARFATRTADEWEAALLVTPAAAAKCNTLGEWLAHDQARGVLTAEGEVAPPLKFSVAEGGRGPRGRHGSEGGALAGHRVIDIASFWAGPLAARILAELGADVIKVEPPGGEGAFHLVPALPNIYVDGNRSKRGLTLDLADAEDRRRLLDLVRAADVVVENAIAGAWERLGLGEDDLRSINPDLVYARAKGFGVDGALAPRPSFDYVVQAATGMIMTQGGGRAQPMNFTVNDYGTGLHLAAGIVLALLARARGTRVTGVEASLMMTATVWQSEHVAQIAAEGQEADDVGVDLQGPAPGRHLYEAADGWLAVFATTPEQEVAVGEPAAIATMTVDEGLARLAAFGVPAAASVHPRAVPDDEQVRARSLLVTTRHRVAGRVVQVGVPIHLSADPPAVKGPAPTPLGRPRR